MKKISIDSLTLQNVKGHKFAHFDFNGRNAALFAENGCGKTAIKDAICWLWVDQDSEGKSQFPIRPLDENNNPIPNLEVAVTMVMDLNGEKVKLHRVQTEKITKGAVTGYTNERFINDVPKLEKEFNTFIADIMPIDTFKILTDIMAFNADSSKWGWQQRRKLLLDIAGDCGKPEGFEPLMATLTGRTIDEYKQVLNRQKKEIKEAADKIPVRIDEINLNLKAYVGTDTQDLRKKKAVLESTIAELIAQRAAFVAQEKNRQKLIDKVNELVRKKITREGELRNDNSAIAGYLAERDEIDRKMDIVRGRVRDAERAVADARIVVFNKKHEYDGVLAIMRDLQSQKVNIEGANLADVCYNCKQPLPADMIAKSNANKQAKINEIIEKGKLQRKSLDDISMQIKQAEARIAELTNLADAEKVALKEAEVYQAERVSQINEIIKNKPEPDFAKDAILNQIATEIAATQSLIGDNSVSDTISAIDNDKALTERELSDVNSLLASEKAFIEGSLRVDELKKQEKQYAAETEKINQELNVIERYIEAESNLIESQVNGRFRHVTFKLFKRAINGNVEATCESLYKGVPYIGMSGGQSILVGVDITNMLSMFYGISLPLIIDNAETLTYDISDVTSGRQVIKLFAKKSDAENDYTKLRMILE